LGVRVWWHSFVMKPRKKGTYWLRDSNARQSSDLRRAGISWAGTPVSNSVRSRASLGRAGTLGGMTNHGFGRDGDRHQLLTALIGVVTFLWYYNRLASSSPSFRKKTLRSVNKEKCHVFAMKTRWFISVSTRVLFYVPQNAQNEVRYVSCCDVEGGSDT
jgi:hypothetical protein